MQKEDFAKSLFLKRKTFAVIIGGFLLLLFCAQTILVLYILFGPLSAIEKRMNEVGDIAEQTLYRVSAQQAVPRR